MANKRLRIGIIGTGGIAHAHARAYKKFSDVEIVAGCDIVPGKAAKFFEELELSSAKAFDSLEDMLDSVELDAVSVCTYNSTHAVCTVRALEAGLHVLLEKPMCVTMEEAASIMKAEKKSGKIVSIGFQPRYDGNMKKMREIVSSGALGEIYYIQTGGGRRRGIPGGTFVEKRYAAVGALADIGCYALDMVLSAIGYPKPLTVSAAAWNKFGTNPKYTSPEVAKRFDVDDFSAAYIRLEGGIVLDFRMSWAMHMDTTGNTIILGTDAGLRIEPAGKGTPWGGAWDGTIGGMTLFHDAFGTMTETPIPQQDTPVDRFEQKVRAFVDAVLTNSPAPIPTSQIVHNQAIIDGIIRSSALGREVECIIPTL